MTQKEHTLMIYMFAQQSMVIKSLVEILKSRNVLDDGDLDAFDALVLRHETLNENGVIDHVAKEYQGFAKTLGVKAVSFE
jgi:hypothetical protein